MNSLLASLNQMSAGRRATALLVALGTVGVLWGFFSWATRPAWVPVMRDVPMESMAAVTTRLDDEGIGYRLDRGGSGLSVTEKDLARARVALAAEGLPSAGAPGFELFDQPSWGMTDFTQRVNYRRALEGELERTIGGMRGVKSAQVHLALRESSFLRQADQAAQASVVVGVAPGFPADEAMVRGIQSLVAGSVEGLETGNVTVLSDGGRVLSASADPSDPSGLSSGQMEMRQEVETYLEGKVEALVSRITGPGNASIRVAADLDFDRLDRTTQAVDPESQVTVQEDRSEIVPGTVEQGASSLTSTATYETSRTVETLSRTGVRISRLSVAVLVNAGAEGENAGVTAARLQQIEALVRSAVGLDDTRGDVISVAAVPFGPTPEAPVTPPVAEEMTVLDWIEVLQRPVIGLLGVLVTALVAFRLLGALKAPAGAAGLRGELPAGEGEGAERLASGADGEADEAPSRPRTIRQPEIPTVELERPDMTARVVRAWMQEA